MNLMRCKACGYIMEEGKLGKVCPACGVKRIAFEPYKEKVSQKRMSLIRLFLHPMTIHFPQGFVVTIVFLCLLGYFVSGVLQAHIVSAVRVLCVLLPFSVAGGFVTGLLDGKLRFKKLGTPHLKLKIYAGAVFFVFSLLALAGGLSSTAGDRILFYGLLTGVPGVICSIILGKIGEKLIYAVMPGGSKLFRFKL